MRYRISSVSSRSSRFNILLNVGANGYRLESAVMSPSYNHSVVLRWYPEKRIFDERSIFIHNRNETLWQNRVNINKGRRINLKRYIYFFALARNSNENRIAKSTAKFRVGASGVKSDFPDLSPIGCSRGVLRQIYFQLSFLCVPTKQSVVFVSMFIDINLW